MTTPNVVDLSKYQTKAINGSMDIDFADLKANGIKAVIIQLGHGVIQDPAAESFIAKANAVGLIVHGYHFFESGHADQVQFSITNAQQLGLSKNAYYFLDMEGNISGSWSDQFRPFYRNWKMNGWNVGLYASLSKYGLFNMDEFKTNHVYKWVANWDVTQAPGVADIWQYNCSTGLGSYTLKLDKDVDIAGNLIQPIDKPKPIATDPNGKFNVQAGAFVNFDYSTTEIQGGKMLVASPDGVNKIPKLYPDGTFGFINKDFDHIWEGIKDRFKSLTISNKVQWADILNRPDVATQADLKAIELKPGPQGPQGLPGKDGITPHVDSTTGDWFIGNQDTGTQAQGPAGKNGRNGVDGQPGKDGQNGITPHIDTATGNWFVGSTDTGIKAQGPQGAPGEPGKDAPLPDMSQYALVSSLDKLKATLNSNIDASKVAYEQIYPTLINGTTGSVNAFLITLSEKVKMLSFWANITLPTIPAWSQVDIMSFPEMHEQNHITLNQSVIPDNYHSLWSDYTSTRFSLRNQTGATVSNYSFNFFSSGIFLY